MPPSENNDRRIEIYMGPSRKVDLTKGELADFIIEKMGLVRSDGGPKWTEGVAELVELGMEAFKERGQNHPEFGEEIAKLNRKLDEYQAEVEKIATTGQEPVDSRIHAAILTHRTQARILKVLCDHARIDDMNVFIELTDVAKEADLEYSAVSHHTRLLDLTEFVERNKYGDHAKAASPDAFHVFCKTRGVDSELIEDR